MSSTRICYIIDAVIAFVPCVVLANRGCVNVLFIRLFFSYWFMEPKLSVVRPAKCVKLVISWGSTSPICSFP